MSVVSDDSKNVDQKFKFTMKNRQNFHSPLIESYDIHEISRWCSRKHCSVAFFPSAGKLWGIIYQLTEKEAGDKAKNCAVFYIAIS